MPVYTLGIVNLNIVHHLRLTHKSWWQWWIEYYVCVYGYMHLWLWTRRVCITCESRMHPDVYSSLSIGWYVYVETYTWHNELEQCASLGNHACILTSILFRVLWVCLWNLHFGLWSQSVCITCERCMRPDVYRALSFIWCVLVEYTLRIVILYSVHHCLTVCIWCL